MRYILANRNKATDHGFNPDTHKAIGDKIIIAECEVRYQWPTFEAAVKDLGGEVKTNQELRTLLNR